MSPWLLIGWALVSGLISHRVWRMASYDTIFDPIRKRVLPDPSWWADLVYCPWCLGWWLNVAVGLTLVLTGTLDPISAALVVLAGSTVTGVIGRGD